MEAVVMREASNTELNLKSRKAISALEAFQEAMRGEAERVGLNSEEDIEKFIKEIRNENPRRY